MGRPAAAPLVALVSLLTGATAAADGVAAGARAGLRATTLTGQLETDWAFRPAVAGVFFLQLSDAFAVGAEPGLAVAGSGKYRLTWFDLPIVAQGRYPLAARAHLRGSAGLGPGLRLAATELSEYEGETTGDDIGEHLRKFDLGLVAGAALEWRQAPGRWFFVELRYGRGLTTVDRDEPGLFVVRQELGIWIGGHVR